MSLEEAPEISESAAPFFRYATDCRIDGFSGTIFHFTDGVRATAKREAFSDEETDEVVQLVLKALRLKDVLPFPSSA